MAQTVHVIVWALLLAGLAPAVPAVPGSLGKQLQQDASSSPPTSSRVWLYLGIGAHFPGASMLLKVRTLYTGCERAARGADYKRVSAPAVLPFPG